MNEAGIKVRKSHKSVYKNAAERKQKKNRIKYVHSGNLPIVNARGKNVESRKAVTRSIGCKRGAYVMCRCRMKTVVYDQDWRQRDLALEQGRILRGSIFAAVPRGVWYLWGKGPPCPVIAVFHIL